MTTVAPQPSTALSSSRATTSKPSVPDATRAVSIPIAGKERAETGPVIAPPNGEIFRFDNAVDRNKIRLFYLLLALRSELLA